MTADERMTDYTLPEGMTAEKLRELADDPVANKVHAALHAWADAIDPPKPVVTDEMVDEVANETIHPAADGYLTLGMIQGVLEAAVKCGWTPPNLESDNDNPSLGPDDDYWRLRCVELGDRLEMAEGLLQQALYSWGGGRGDLGLSLSTQDITPDEAEYLRSLTRGGQLR